MPLKLTSSMFSLSSPPVPIFNYYAPHLCVIRLHNFGSNLKQSAQFAMF